LKIRFWSVLDARTPFPKRLYLPEQANSYGFMEEAIGWQAGDEAAVRFA